MCLISGTHCIRPPLADAPSNVVAVEYEGEPVTNMTLFEFNDPLQYICPHGTKFEDDFDRPSVTARCKVDNVWDTPSFWGFCVASKILLQLLP